MSQPPWTADIPIDATLAKRLVGEQFPKLRGATVDSFGMGWDNAAFLVDGRFVFRFPRRRAFANLIDREIAVLPLLEPQLPLAISAPTFGGIASDDYPWAFAGYPLIRGATACSVALDEDARGALAKPLAEFLRALHGIAVAPPVERGLPSDELGRLDHPRLLTRLHDRVPGILASGEVRNAEGAVAWFESHPPRSLPASERRVVHGDLYARHVILNDRLGPAGIIDWGDMHLGDPALDLAIAHLMLPRSAHASFRNAYGEISEGAWETAKYRAIYSAILVLDYGLNTEDERMRTIGVDALRLMA